MCVVIDTCCLSRVFESGNKEHSDFAPVLKWITPPGKGRLIYGGSTYERELNDARKFVKFINQLKRAGRAIRVADDKVDRIEHDVIKTINDNKCDDPHLIAIVIASRCCVVCTCDRRAIPYLIRSDLYRKYSMKRPRIYSSKSNKDLCSDKYVVGVCRRH